MTKKTDSNYGKGEVTIADDDSLDPVLKQIRVGVKEVVSKETYEIPLLPTVATQVLHMANDPKAGIPEIEKLVNQDQVIAAKVIKTANSPFYRGVSTIVSLRDAMGRIGLRALKDIVFSLSLQSKVFKTQGFESTLDQVWKHSLSCATLSQLIAKKAGVDSEYAFLAGLLHDIGKPVLIQVVAQLQELEKKKKVDEAKKAFKPFDPKNYKVENLNEVLVPLVFQEYHAVVGALVAAKWKLPNLIIEVIRYHHEYEKSKEARTMCLVVHLANLLCHHFGYGHEEAPVILQQQKPFFELNLQRDQIDKIADEAPKAIDAISGMM